MKLSSAVMLAIAGLAAAAPVEISENVKNIFERQQQTCVRVGQSCQQKPNGCCNPQQNFCNQTFVCQSRSGGGGGGGVSPFQSNSYRVRC